MRISSVCLCLALISSCTAYAQAQDSRYSRYKECSWRLGHGYYCGGFPPETCCEVADTPRCVPKSELGRQRCECVDKYDCDVFSENCWRYTCINRTTIARSVTLKLASNKVNTSEPYYCDSDSDCLVNKTCKDGKCTARDRSTPFDNIGVRVAIRLGCAILFTVPMTWFLNRWLPRLLGRFRQCREQEINLRVRTEPGNSDHIVAMSEVASQRETDEHEFVCCSRCLPPTEATPSRENEHEMQTANNPTSPKTVLEVEGDNPEASPPYNPAFNPSHSAPVLGTSTGCAVSVGVPAGGSYETGVQDMIVANSNSTMAEIRDNVLFPPGVPPPYHSLTFERHQNASDNLPVQPPPSYEATVREILI